MVIQKNLENGEILTINTTNMTMVIFWKDGGTLVVGCCTPHIHSNFIGVLQGTWHLENMEF